MPRLEQTEQQLICHREKGLWRAHKTRNPSTMPYIAIDGKKLLHGCCNDYLGLSIHPTVIKACQDAAALYGISAQASPVVAGQCSLHQQLEETLADYYRQDKALLFSSGYMANVAMIQTLIGKEDHAFGDKLNHASLIRTLATGPFLHKRFDHRNPEHLAQLLEQHPSNHANWIISDTLFSMKGQTAPIAKIEELAQKHHAYVMWDNTHGIGAIDPLLQHTMKVPGVISFGFGKALGTQGGCVTGPQALIEAMAQWAPQYMFSTALCPPIVAATLASMQVLKKEPERIAHLSALIETFIKEATAAQLPIEPSTSPIQIIQAPSTEDALTWSQRLHEKGFFIRAIRPPTVPKNQTCLRLVITHHNTEAQIKSWVSAISDSIKK